MTYPPHFSGTPLTNPVVRYDEDSDDDLSDIPISNELHIFTRAGQIPASAMTVVCCDRNVKGNTLLEIVHDTIQNLASEAIDLACEYEKDIGRSVISAPNFKQSPDGKWLLSLESPNDWFMTIGGWKGMMPSEEFRGLFFFRHLGFQEKHFDAVEIFENGIIFPIQNFRIHLPQNFSIDGFAVTGYKTDLTYYQIVNVMTRIKTITSLSDAQIAHLQLCRLSRENAPDSEIEEKIPARCRNEIFQFLDYLNCLMFGVEPSGLNAGLAISLMTLELIALGELSYQIAFNANTDGGFYPYACFGNNKGTYNQREQALLQSKQNRDAATMKAFRANGNLSPVAAKETITIKAWLEHTQSINRSLTYEDQINSIQTSVKQLINRHYFPHML